MPEYEVIFRTSTPTADQEQRILDELDGFVGGHGETTLVTVSDESDREPRNAALTLANRIFDLGLVVHRIEPDLVNAASIAKRCNVSRAAVGMWARGERLPEQPPFPAPAVFGPTQLWRWEQVNRWLAQLGKPRDDVTYLSVDDETWVNYQLLTKCQARVSMGGEWTPVRRPTGITSGWQTAGTLHARVHADEAKLTVGAGAR